MMVDETPDALNHFADRFREAGRQDVLRDVAKLPSPVYGGPAFRMDCHWCKAKWRIDMPHPDNGCLWPRALKALAGTTARP